MDVKQISSIARGGVQRQMTGKFLQTGPFLLEFIFSAQYEGWEMIDFRQCALVYITAMQSY
jgi:hypothetical protein